MFAKRGSLIVTRRYLLNTVSVPSTNGVGVCGKEGQSLPVGVGQPTLKVDNLTVGGTA